jgi:hypothetical protein
MNSASGMVPTYRKERRFAWKPRRLSDGSWIWLKSYWVKLPIFAFVER